MSASIELLEQVRARYAQAGISAASLPREAIEASLGCGNSTMVAEAAFTGVSV